MPAAAAALSPALSALLTGAVVLSGSGIICLSGDALPGDPLHGIKTSINEPVRAGLAISPGAQARVSTDQAVERLIEAEQLAVLTDLTPARAEALANRFQVLSDEAQKKLSSMSNLQAAIDGAAALELELDAHADHLAALRANADGNVRAGLDGLEADVRAEAADARNLRVALEAKAGVDAAEADAQALLADAKAEIADARARLAEQRASLGARLTADLDAQLDAADRLVAAGQANLDADAFAEASDLARVAGSVASDATVLGDTLINLRPQTDEQAAAVLRSVSATGDAMGSVSGSGNVGGSVGGTGASVGGSGSGSATGSLDLTSGLNPILDVDGNGVVDLDGGAGLKVLP